MTAAPPAAADFAGDPPGVPAARKTDGPGRGPGRRGRASPAPRSELARANFWTLRLEAVSRRTMKQASGYSWMYEQMVARAKKWGDALAILSGVLGGVIGTQGLISVLRSSPAWAGGITTAVGYVITVLVMLERTWRLDFVRSKGLVAQVDFAHLGRSIQFQLALRPSERQDARDFVKGILNEIETLKLSSPTLEGWVRDLYSAKFKDNPVYNPEDQWEDLRTSIAAGALAPAGGRGGGFFLGRDPEADDGDSLYGHASDDGGSDDGDLARSPAGGSGRSAAGSSSSSRSAAARSDGAPPARGGGDPDDCVRSETAWGLAAEASDGRRPALVIHAPALDGMFDAFEAECAEASPPSSPRPPA